MKRKIISITAVVILAISLGCIGYVDDYYRAEEVALQSMDKAIEKDNYIIFEAEVPAAGLIFYPGGKVQCESYAPLMEALAEQGITSILVRMPANLAVLNINAADGLPESYPEVTSWYIGGHSLGGSMAASYAAKHVDSFEGLLLLASYSTAELKDSGMRVLSIYGTEDQVLNMEKYEEYRMNLPEVFNEFIIEGGCHAYFGSYGEQEGDGKPTISNTEQLQTTAEEIMKWMIE